jgi:hypothetical protein
LVPEADAAAARIFELVKANLLSERPPSCFKESAMRGARKVSSGDVPVLEVTMSEERILVIAVTDDRPLSITSASFPVKIYNIMS